MNISQNAPHIALGIYFKVIPILMSNRNGRVHTPEDAFDKAIYCCS